MLVIIKTLRSGKVDGFNWSLFHVDGTDYLKKLFSLIQLDNMLAVISEAIFCKH